MDHTSISRASVFNRRADCLDAVLIRVPEDSRYIREDSEIVHEAVGPYWLHILVEKGP